jgi:gliding motility-associated-like protein
MKKSLPVLFRGMLIAIILFFSAGTSFASHIVGGDIYYTWISGNTYRVTVVLYGDCGPLSAAVFASLPTGAPQVCLYNGSTYVSTITCAIQAPSAGVEITPVCPDSLAKTQCTNTSFSIPGIKKFVYTSPNVVLPGTSANWRFIFNSAYGGSSAGRAAAITNIVGPGGTSMQLEATLNNTVYSNSSPSLTVVPTPFFCVNTPICYTPGAIDPEDDSLRFDLVPATLATGGCASVGGPVTYTGAAWPGTPVSATTPLRCVSGSFSFSSVNGQVCFNPDFTQRSIVVYNVSEFRDGMLVGTCQREMTFLVRPCIVFAPEPGVADTGGVIIPDGPTSFHVCGDEGAFTIELDPTADPSPVVPLNVTCLATGLPAGITFSVTGNGTPNPHVTFSGNASTMAPGVYTFFLSLRDNACPLNGNNTIAYTVTIYPVPTISHTVVSEADCTHKAVVRIQPGGTGKPWTIKVSDPLLPLGADTFQTFVDSVAFYDTLEPGPLPGPNLYHVTIYTSVSTECALWDTIRLAVPSKLLPAATPVDPTYCGNNDGYIVISNLNAGGIDTITYDKFGIPQPPIIAIVSSARTLTIPNLRAGIYDNIVVHYGYCTADPIGPVELVDPPFTLRTLTYQDPSKCGFCDGWIKLDGIHPDQLDTITYNKNGAPQPATSFYVNSDSTITLPGLCEATYTTFTVKTAGNCSATLTTVVPLVAPKIFPLFDTLVKYGCKGDTLMLTNNSTPASDLTYSWNFGDGGTSTEINPIHVYTNTVGSNYVIKLYITNTQCVDSLIKELPLNHFVKADYTMDPPQFLCQIDAVNFTNTSTGTGVDYKWYFADGGFSTSTNVAHSYTNMGTYNTILSAHNVTAGVHCYDTMIRTIIVDSNSVLTLKVSGDVTAICRGQAITLSAIYTTSGDTGNVWSLTDGFEMNNVNPLMHSFEGTGPMVINFDAKFRACPEKTGSLNIHVFDVPGIYLGPDTAICVGSSPIHLKDDRNATNSKAKWRWNTDETTSGIIVSKPGIYAATVTIDGCTTTDTVIVRKDCYVDVPNVFTPNGDGVNDYFFPRGFLSRGVTSFNMSIYNRWGQLIYETSNISGQGWDGALNSVQQPTGVYIYSIDATFKDGQIEQHKGNVTLLR